MHSALGGDSAGQSWLEAHWVCCSHSPSSPDPQAAQWASLPPQLPTLSSCPADALPVSAHDPSLTAVQHLRCRAQHILAGLRQCKPGPGACSPAPDPTHGLQPGLSSTAPHRQCPLPQPTPQNGASPTGQATQWPGPVQPPSQSVQLGRSACPWLRLWGQLPGGPQQGGCCLQQVLCRRRRVA